MIHQPGCTRQRSSTPCRSDLRPATLWLRNQATTPMSLTGLECLEPLVHNSVCDVSRLSLSASSVNVVSGDVDDTAVIQKYLGMTVVTPDEMDLYSNLRQSPTVSSLGSMLPLNTSWSVSWLMEARMGSPDLTEPESALYTIGLSDESNRSPSMLRSPCGVVVKDHP